MVDFLRCEGRIEWKLDIGNERSVLHIRGIASVSLWQAQGKSVVTWSIGLPRC
jgi:hypothetical protein